MDTRHFQVLRVKIVAVTLFFSLVPLFALGITIYHEFSASYRSKIAAAARSLAQNRRNSLELFFRERISQLTTVARTDTLGQLRDENYLTKVFNVMQAQSKSYIDLGVIDQDGNHVAYVGPYHEKLKSVNYAEADWFHAVMAAGVYVSDVFLGFRKSPHLILAVTVVEGNTTWILRATINSEIIEEVVKEAQVGRQGDAFLINKNNILQTASRFSGSILDRPSTPDFSAAVGTRVEEIEYAGQEFLFATTPLTYPKWVLVIKEDTREELTPLLHARYMAALILAGGVLLVVVASILTSRSMTNELMRVEREKASADELLMHSGKMAALGKMAAGVAHEINNPLQVISEKAGWMSDLLKSEEIAASENFEEFQDCIKKIERQVERCRSITHRMLRFGRRMEPTQDMVDVNLVLSETVSFLENEAHHRDITINVEYENDIPRVTTDASQLQQVFLNIIDNAIDAVGDFGIINVRTGVSNGSGRELFVEIADNGPGIPKETLKKIFDPFFTTKSTNSGTGLGLSISHSIMQKLGGRITVESETGQGTTFTLYVPVL
ncbi:MAG: GHKL domain-containing protein [Desulfomonile tiedjei]|nr:GHKL domain-containing protein [Desulfomonile tiedjei]